MAAKIEIRCITCGAYGENAYLIWADGADQAALVGPGGGVELIEAALVESGKALGAIFLTHGHFDHTLAAPQLARRHGASIYAHEDDLPMLEDEALNLYNPADADLPPPKDFGARAYPAADGGTFEICGLRLQLLHTPGHTPGSVCLYDEENGALFSGDTMFASAFGRTDFPGGSTMQMRRSLRRLLLLPEQTRVYPGHQEATTIARERAHYRF